MALDPEAVQAALYARLSDPTKITGLNFTTRQYLDYSAVPSKPALLVIAHGGRGNRRPAVGSIWTMQALVVFYVRTPNDKTTTVETSLFGLMKQLDAALQRQPNEISPDDDPGTTLGGLVFRCFRTDYQIHHGAEVGEAAATMTIEMVAPE